MTGPWVLLVVGVPLLLAGWLLLDGPADRMARRREVTVRRAYPSRIYQRARSVGRPRRLSTMDGRRTGLTVEQVGVVVPDVPLDPAKMVPAAAQAFVESRAMEAVEQTPAYQAAAVTPAAQATAGTPLAEETPLRIETD